MVVVVPDQFLIDGVIGDGGRLEDLAYLNYIIFPKCGTKERQEFERNLSLNSEILTISFDGEKYMYQKSQVEEYEGCPNNVTSTIDPSCDLVDYILAFDRALSENKTMRRKVLYELI